MNKPWLLLDASNLAWRAFYSTGGLSHMGQDTGVTFGIMRDIQNLRQIHRTDRLVFCFDVGRNKRCDIYQDYKANHKPITDNDKKKRHQVHVELALLRLEYLPFLGYKNVLWDDGYEADDIIASVVRWGLPEDSKAIIVSTDQDLYQLLRSNVSIWNPVKDKLYTKADFIKQWGIKPRQWATVKAIAGCESDNVKGIKGIGDKTAAKYLRGTLKKTTKAWDRIDHSEWESNERLVRLPLSGVKRFPLTENEATQAQWRALCGQLGMKTLIDPMEMKE